MHYPIAEQLFKHETFRNNANALTWGRVSDWPGYGPPPVKGFELLLGYLYEQYQHGKVELSTIQSWCCENGDELASLYIAAAYFHLETVQDQVINAIFLGGEIKQILVSMDFIFLYTVVDDCTREKFKQRFNNAFCDFLSDLDDEFGPWEWNPSLSRHQIKKLMAHMISMNQELIDDIGRDLLERIIRQCFERHDDATIECETDDEDMTNYTPRVGPSGVAISRSNELCTLDFEVGETITNIQVVEANPFTAPMMSGRTGWGNGRFPANYVKINDDENFNIKAAIAQLRTQSPPLW